MTRNNVKDLPVFANESALKKAEFVHSKLVDNLDVPNQQADIHVVTRISSNFLNVADKVYSRDWFGSDN